MDIAAYDIFDAVIAVSSLIVLAASLYETIYSEGKNASKLDRFFSSPLSPWNWWEFVSRKIKGSTRGSKFRRILGYGAIVLVTGLFVEAWFNIPYKVGAEAYIIVLYAVGFFASTTFVVLNLSDERFVVEPFRLIKDTAISCALIILAAALFYRDGGVTTGACMPPAEIPKWNSVYFSAVTFSTLGYGDLKPCGYAKIVAVGQAMLGNVHLAFLVSASFLAINNKSKEAKKAAEDAPAASSSE